MFSKRKEIEWKDVLDFCRKKKEKKHMTIIFATEFCSAIGLTSQQCEKLKENLEAKEQFAKEERK
jgi:hypothetical protein